MYALMISLCLTLHPYIRLPQDIQDLCIKYEEVEGVDRHLLMAFCEVESNGKADVISANGQYVGLMQLNKDYFQGDLTDAENNISQGSAYLKRLFEQHGSYYRAISYYSGEGGKIGYYSMKVIRRMAQLKFNEWRKKRRWKLGLARNMSLRN